MSMYAITGATGLVGSHLLYFLAQKDKNVKALYRNKEKINEVKQLFHLLDKTNADKLWQKVKWIKADVRDFMDLTEAFEGVKAVFHTAALVSFRKADKQTLKSINWQGTNNVVNACLDAKVEYLSYISSIAALDGVVVDGKINEELSNSKLKEKLYYGQTKFDAEKEVFRGIVEGLKASIVNPTIILGFSASNQSSASLFHQVNHGMPVYADGSTDFVDVRDVVQILWQLYEKQSSGERFILSGGHLSYKELLSRIAKQLNKPVPKYKIPLSLAKFGAAISEILRPKTSFITVSSVKTAYEHSYYSNNKICEYLNYNFISPADSIEYTANLYKMSIGFK